MKYVIIGGRKCGTTSLEKYLKTKGLDVVRREQLFTRYDGYDSFCHEFPDYKPILIIRNPEDRAYSDWKYAKQEKRTELSYKEYCETPKYNHPSLGEINPLEQSKYKKWLLPWKDSGLAVFQLEILKVSDGFPKENVTEGKMTESEREWTKEKLDEM